MREVEDINILLSIFYKLILDRLNVLGFELTSDIKDMVGLILIEVKEKEENNKYEGIDFIVDLIDPKNSDFETYFLVKDDEIAYSE
jgi:hypothetical protein